MAASSRYLYRIERLIYNAASLLYNTNLVLADTATNVYCKAGSICKMIFELSS